MFFSTLFELGKTAAIGFLLNDYFRRYYPSEHTKAVIDVAFNVIYVYSHCQIYMNNALSYISIKTPFLANYLKEIFTFNTEKISTIHFVKNNSVVLVKTTLNELDFEQPEHDFIVYTDGKSKPNNMKIIRNADIHSNNFNYEKSKIKFMMIEFKMDDKTYVIDLANNSYNFYIKDNIFDKQFFLYYLRYFHTDKVNVDETFLQMDEVTLKIIDHNVDIKTIYFTKNTNQYIKLNEIDYTIIEE